MPLIWSLKLPARQRLAVISIFGLGIIVNVAGSVRTVYVWKSMVASYDTTWVGWPVLVAAAVEISLGLVCHRIHSRIMGETNKQIRSALQHQPSGPSSQLFFHTCSNPPATSATTTTTETVPKNSGPQPAAHETLTTPSPATPDNTVTKATGSKLCGPWRWKPGPSPDSLVTTI
jgi:hypothetical protein